MEEENPDRGDFTWAMNQLKEGYAVRCYRWNPNAAVFLFNGIYYMVGKVANEEWTIFHYKPENIDMSYEWIREYIPEKLRASFTSSKEAVSRRPGLCR
jgi:hypothetical protein